MSQFEMRLGDEHMLLRAVGKPAAVNARTAELRGHEVALLIFLVTLVLVCAERTEDRMKEHLVVEAPVHPFKAFAAAEGIV